MNKHVSVMALLLAVGCVTDTTQAAPLVLPATLVEAKGKGHRVTLALRTSCEDLAPPESTSPAEYCLHADIILADEGMIEANVIQLHLPGGYRKGDAFQPHTASGGGGAGGGRTGPGSNEMNLPFRPQKEADPMAFFLEVHTRTAAGEPDSSQTLGPVVLQLLPAGTGIARLDQ